VLLGTGGKQKDANGSTSAMCQIHDTKLSHCLKIYSANFFAGFGIVVPNTLLNPHGFFLDYL
jgi:hypothetical protein